MKLLYCGLCGAIFNLARLEKSCPCGNATGRYLDTLNAVYAGKAVVPLGFANSSFHAALIHQPLSGWGERYEAFVIPVECPTFVQKEESDDSGTGNVQRTARVRKEHLR